MSTLQNQGSQHRGWRPDAESAAGGQLILGALTSTTGQLDDQDTTRMVINALKTRRGPSDPEAQGNQLIAFHQTQDPISEVDGTPALNRTSIGMGVMTSQVRRLTPVECERLMSWPDNWTAGVRGDSNSARYSACGDGVVANVAEWIGRRITAVERSHLDLLG